MLKIGQNWGKMQIIPQCSSKIGTTVNSVTNMAANSDIDALKIFKKSRTTLAENRQKIKNSRSQLKIYRF